jgi:hypothetical protein
MKRFCLFLVLLAATGALSAQSLHGPVPASDTALHLAGPSVSFVYFMTSPGNAGAFLQWRVSHTEGLQYFVVERSIAGAGFRPLAIVNSKSEQLVYVFKDDAIVGTRRKASYRIKVVEAGGTVPSPVRPLKAAK